MALLLLALLTVAYGGVRRFAVLVGNNEGHATSRPLYFAEQDAQKVHALLTSIGQVAPDDAVLLLGQNRNEVLSALVGLRGRVNLAHERGDDTVLLFYYSGHADDERLQLGRTWLTWDELSTLLDKTGADVRMAFVDACQSGSMTKGGTRAPGFVFDLSERLDASGQVVITSSASNEASQESDEIGGSYFTHYLTSGLYGAADEDGDTAVTLSEVYRYVYRETVFRTSSTRSGAQHPTYEWDLKGTGDVVLADLGAAQASLYFPASMPGRYAIFDKNRRRFVAEVALDGEAQKLSLQPGTYLVQERFPTYLNVAEVNIRDGTQTSLASASFAAVEYEDDVAKGTIDRQIRQAQLPRLSLRVVAGTRGFADEEVRSEYLPSTPVAGAVARFAWRDGRWVAVDVLSGAGAGALQFEDLGYTVPVTVSSTTFGLSAGFATKPRLVRAGVGLRLAGAWFHRDFPSLDLPGQDLLGATPGVVIWAGIHPGRMEIDLEIRNQYLPYLLDDREKGVGFNEGLLAVGYRF